MDIELKVEEDENFKIVKEEEKVVEQPPVQKVDERPQPTLENKKGHPWFNGTSWGLQ
jgi:hypothetical protein